jgi:hypothetical protein
LRQKLAQKIQISHRFAGTSVSSGGGSLEVVPESFGAGGLGGILVGSVGILDGSFDLVHALGVLLRSHPRWQEFSNRPHGVRQTVLGHAANYHLKVLGNYLCYFLLFLYFSLDHLLVQSSP